MPAQRNTNVAGLWIAPSTLQAPVGAYIQADNTVINSPGILESRRGFLWLPYELSVVETVYPKASFSFRGTLLVQHRNKLSYNSGVAFVPYSGDYAPPAPQLLRMRSQEMQLNFYFTSDSGVYEIDEPTGEPVSAGLDRGPTPTSTLNATRLTGTADDGWMPTDAQTVYVTTRFRVDANETDHEGTPSNPIFVINQDIEIPIGDVIITDGITGEAAFDYPNHGFQIGDSIIVTFGGAEGPSFQSGTYTIIATGFSSSQFRVLGCAFGVNGTVTIDVTTVSNGSKNVQVYVQLNSTYDAADDVILVYRSKVSGGADVTPRPQYYLAKEYTVTSTDITNGYLTFEDELPDSLLQQPLYTNTDDGEPPDSSLQNDNGQPPFCIDLAEFDQRLWGANYQELQTLSFSLLGTGAPNGLQAGDTITIGSNTFTAVTEATTPSISQFRVYTSGADPAGNVARTAQELALQASSTSNFVEVFYTSGVDDIPGQMLARSRIPGGVSFELYVSRPSAWNPVFTTSSTGAVTSTASPATNGLWFSKRNQPEAVPLLNRLAVGPKNANILRIRPLRDKLLVFTDIAGAYIVSNSYPYQITSMDSTAILVVPDSLVNFDKAIYALTTQGVVRFNEAGPTILSIPIESEIKALFGAGLSNLKIKAFGIGYESYRKYLLAMPATVEDTNNTEVWAYDTVTQAWTRWTKAIDSGVVIPQTDYLYVTTPESTKVSQERKNFDRTDYADEDYQVTITAAADEVVTVTSTIEPEVGDLLYQTPIIRALVLEVENTGVNTYSLTLNSTVSWTLGAATNYPGIQITSLNTPVFAGGAEERKHFREVTYHFRTPGFNLGKALFSGDTNPAVYEVDFSKGGWGDVSWGNFAWEQPARPVNKRVSIPTPARRVSYVTTGFAIREAQAQWQLMGITPVYENMSERNTK